MKKIGILLSSFNGEEYIKTQVESILQQSYTQWKLFIRDDGSSDNTVKIIKHLAAMDDRIVLFEEKGNMGIVKSFLTLLRKIDMDYYMFCDQDDFWLEDKLKNALQLMLVKEQLEQKPYLVHTDLKVVDASLGLISESMFKYQNILSFTPNYTTSFFQNNVTGCTIMINRQLRDLCQISDEIIMHDWWLALICHSFGEILFLRESSILYRQHLNNSVGANVF